MSESDAERGTLPLRDGKNSGMESKKRQEKGRMEDRSEKEVMQLHSEQQAYPRRGHPTAVKTILSSRQTERGSKVFWNAEAFDGHRACCWGTRIASEPLSPRETKVSTLRAGKKHISLA
jgi:hypothetical protein